MRARTCSERSRSRPWSSVDLGDIIGAEGTVFATKRGELSLRVESWALLAKSLRPPPDKFHGLEDVEVRYRHRELDLIANPEVRELFTKRAQVVTAVREWLDARGFVEVETPVLQPLYGGALARPFVTHHNALDRDLYLRIATELYLKRLHRRRDRSRLRARQGLPQRGHLAQAQPRVHDARVVRGLRGLQGRRRAARAARRRRSRSASSGRRRSSGTATRSTSAPPWRRVTLRDAIKERTGLDLARASEPRGARRRAGPRAGAGGGLGEARRRGAVEAGRAHPDPAHVHPRLPGGALAVREAPPLRARASSSGGRRSSAGVEIANAFTELNDPDEQRRRFEQQAEELRRGDEDAQPFDEAFVEALEQGMPPTGGVGLGIDRLVMILAGARNLREVVLFPAMRN